MATKQAANSTAQQDLVTIDRRRTDRRRGETESVDAGTTNPPRRKKQRRRHIDPTTCERDYNEQEIEFMRAMDDYKRDAGRMFPTCSEVLEVIRKLGYVQLTPDQIEAFGIDAGEESAQAFEVSVDEDELAEV